MLVEHSAPCLHPTTARRRPASSAADGLEAIELLKKHEYAVILLDLMMPRLDGLGVIDWLRTNPPLIS